MVFFENFHHAHRLVPECECSANAENFICLGIILVPRHTSCFSLAFSTLYVEGVRRGPSEERFEIRIAHSPAQQLALGT